MHVYAEHHKITSCATIVFSFVNSLAHIISETVGTVVNCRQQFNNNVYFGGRKE